MESGIEYHNEIAGVKLSISNTTDLPEIEVIARHTEGLLDKIERGMHAVSRVSSPSSMYIDFINPSIRKASEIQGEHDRRPREQKQIKIPENRDGHSSALILEEGVPLETALEIMKKEYGGFQNLGVSLFYWGNNPATIGIRKQVDVSVYFTNRFNSDEMWEIYEKCALMGEIRKRRLEHFKEVLSITPSSDDPLFMDLTDVLVPIFAPNDKDYVIFFHEPVAGNGLFFTPSEYGAMSRADVVRNYQQLLNKRDDYMRSPEYARSSELMKKFIQGITGLSDEKIDEHASGSSQSIMIEHEGKSRTPKNRRF